MKKVVVAVASLLLLVAGGWWVLDADAPSRDPAPGEASPERLAPELAGRPVPVPSAATASAGALREGDAVPADTFAGRVVDESSRGVAGARVALVWYGVKPDAAEAANGTHLLLRRERERREQPAAVADAEGYFRLDRPYGSRSLLRAEATGYPAAVSGPHPSGSFVLLRLARDAWLDVRVRDEDGAAVGDAEVRLVTATPLRMGFPTPRQVLATARTDADGRARLPTATDGLVLEVVPDRPEWGVVERAVLAAERDVEVRVPRVKVEVRHVVDAETGAPVAGAWVDLLRSAFEGSSPDQEPGRRRFVADAQGVVRFAWQDGYHGRHAFADGYEVADAWDEPIRLTRATRVEGTVADPEGRPVEGAALLVVVPPHGAFEDAYVGRSPVLAWSDAEGRFAFDVRLPHAAHGEAPPDRGVRSVLAVHPDHPAAIADGVAVAPGARRRVDLRFPRPASLDLEIVDRDGKPVADQWFQVSRFVPRAPTWQAPAIDFGVDTTSLIRSDLRRTDATGRASVEGLPPGPHLVRAENTRVEVEVEEGERHVVRMVKGAGPSITGIVLDAKGDPVERVHVGVSGTTAAAKQTGPDGRFRFDDLPPGEYGIGALHPRSRLRTGARARTGDDVVLRLPAGPAKLRIAVDGPPAGTAEYSLYTDTGGAVPDATGFTPLPASGETDGFNPGTGVLVVRAPGHGWTCVRFEARALETTAVRVDLPPAGGVEVRVPEEMLALERESRRGLLRIARTDDRLRRAIGEVGDALLYAVQRSRGSTDDHLHEHVDGLFRASDLSPGPHEVSFGRYGDDRAWVSHGRALVEVVSGRVTRVDLAR
jgi:protocatechuate 3,4-dioxygenase beta subunit